MSLPDARTAPSFLRYLPRARSVTVERQCARGSWWSDVSAYQWNGRALGPQRWHGGDAFPFYYWTRPGTRQRVTFDGITFRNRTLHPVIVAGWCERG